MLSVVMKLSEKTPTHTAMIADVPSAKIVAAPRDRAPVIEVLTLLV